MDVRRPSRATPILLFGLLALIAAALVCYSQTAAFAWDEGFHILTAQLVLHGKKPYLDFCFSQAPLNAFWNAAWMAIFGESWGVAHAVAALCSGIAVALTSGYVHSRFPIVGWRVPGAVVTAILVGLNVLIFRFGGIAQPYGLCLLAIVAAFRLTVLTPDRATHATPALAGFFSGLAAGSSLLTAPVGPVLLLWMCIYNRAGNRIRKAAAFLTGGMIAVTPVLWLWTQGPRQVLFGIVDYNLRYRQSDWPDATRQNLEVLLGAINSGPAVLLILLAAGGLLFMRYQIPTKVDIRAEFYLCAWLSMAIFLYITNVRPTFERYYIFAVPFLSILAVAGLFAASSRLYRADRPWVPIILVSFLVALGLGKDLYDERYDRGWTEMAAVARKVNEVTAPGETLYADEETYFLSRHTPPSGMEEENSHKLNFSAADRALYRIIPQPDLDRMVHDGYFHTLETCKDADFIDEHGFARAYSKHAEVNDCTVFWGFAPGN